MKSSDDKQNRPDVSLMDTPGSLERQPLTTEQKDLNSKRSQGDGDIKGNIRSEQTKKSVPSGQSFFICKKKSQSEINTQSTKNCDDDQEKGERDSMDVLIGSPKTADVKDSGHLNGQLKIRYLYFLTLNQYLGIINKIVDETNLKLGMVAVLPDQPKLAVPETHVTELGHIPRKDRMPRKNESESPLDAFSRRITMAVPKQDVKRIEELPTDPEIKDEKIILRFELSMAGHSWEVDKTVEDFKDVYARKRDMIKNVVFSDIPVAEFPKFTETLVSPEKEIIDKTVKENIKMIDFNENLNNLSIYADKMKTYAGKLIEYMVTFARHKNHDFCYPRFKEFWGISKAFCKARFSRIAEIPIEKVSRGRANELCVVRFCKSLFRRQQKRWLIIGTDNIWYYTDSKKEPKDMADNVMVDRSARLCIAKYTQEEIIIDIWLSRRRILIQLPFYMGLYVYNSLVKAFRTSNYSRINRFNSFAPPRKHNDCELYVDGEGYFEKLKSLIENAKEEIMICGWFISPEMPLIRPIKLKFEKDLANEPTTLMSLLNRVAYRGVRVYILVYQEFSMQMYNDSFHCKKELTKKYPKNIKVLRHPTNIGQSLLWSHHEKMVLIDRKVVMMGGLDIAWGRWDTPDHPLFDNHSGRQFPGVDYYNAYKKDFTKGRDYQNSLINPTIQRMPWHDVACKLEGEIVKDFLRHFITYWNNSREINKEDEVLFSQLSLTNPKHSMSESIKRILRGKIGTDSVIEKLIEKKNRERKIPIKRKEKRPVTTVVPSKPDSGIDLPQNALNSGQNTDQLKLFLSLDDSIMEEERTRGQHSGDNITDLKLEVFGKDKYVELDEAYKLNRELWQPPIEDSGELAAQNIVLSTVFQCVSQKIIERDDKIIEGDSPNMHDLYKIKPKISIFLQRLPDEIRYKKIIDEDSFKHEHTWSPYILESVDPSSHSGAHDCREIPDEGFINNPAINSNRAIYHDKHRDEGNIKMQALRSASFWSAGLIEIERSIQHAYLGIIENAKRFIYIENQFFISSTADIKGDDRSSDKAANRITKAIFKRLKQAILNKEDFKVVIFIPLLPAFEGDLDTDQEGLMQAQIALQRQTMGDSHDGLGLIDRLKEYTPTPDKYIMYCALRKSEFPPGHVTETPQDIEKCFSQNIFPKTELIYIHSKLIIVDDEHLLMGSANLNDRSMQGDRDSELAVCMTGPLNTEVYHNKKLYLVNDKIFEFRLRIFNEHFGLDKKDLLFPNSELFWAKAWNTLRINTYFYDEVFSVLPSAKYSNWAAVKSRKKDKDGNVISDDKFTKVQQDKYSKLREYVKGHAVIYPFSFLKEENLLKMSLLMDLVLPIRALL